MRVVFLDFDGVINSVGSMKYYEQLNKGKTSIPEVSEEFCPISLSNLDWIMRQVPDSRIVISSSWRNMFALDALKGFLSNAGYDWPIIGKTPSLREKLSRMANRADEIRAWVSENEGVEHYVAIDDHYLELPDQHFVQTLCEDGLTFSKANEVCTKFGFPNKQVYLF